MKKILEKIKSSWKENRVLFVLTAILIFCLILIAIVAIDYFLGSSRDKYGDRLSGIEKVQITDKQLKKLESEIEKEETIENCNINKIGKMIYINLDFNETITLVEAEGKALNTLSLFSEDELKFYDVHYSLSQAKTEENEGFNIMGTKNVNGSGLVWNNNTPIEEETEEE